jgi:hypothetical protein
MANLNTNEKQVLEKLFQMKSGYVLNFSDRTMREFFDDEIGIDIYQEKYKIGSGSKANCMRGFWKEADQSIIGKSIQKLIDYIENQILLGELKKEDYPEDLISRSKEIANKLLGVPLHSQEIKEDEFLGKEFKDVNIDNLKLDGTVSVILQQRLDEIRKCLNVKASLSVIFLCGSTLEGILLGIASSHHKDFNTSPSSPKDKTDKVKPFYNWSLNDFINVARELDLLGEDVKKFSHALRDFRNYIHPYEQMSSNFNPDEHTAKICWQVLQTAIIQLSR